MVEWLRSSGVSVSVVNSSANSHGIGSIASTFGAGRYLLARLWSHLICCVRLLRRPNVLYIGGAGGAGLYFQLLPVLVARLLLVPVVFHHHSSAYLTAHSRPMAWMCRLTIGESTHVALSHSMAEQLHTRYAGPRVISLSNAIFVPDAGPAPIRGGTAPVRIGHVSNLSLDKGMQEVVSTATELGAAGEAFELHIAGAAQDERTQARVDRLLEPWRSDSRVFVHGALYGAELERFYDHLDLLLFPSQYRNEAAPLVVLEAASRGVPTLAYPIGSLAELVFAVELLAPVGHFVERATDLVGRWRDVGPELSRVTLDGYQRSREAAAEQRERLWVAYLGRDSNDSGGDHPCAL